MLTVKPDRVNLIEIGHRAVMLGDVAQLGDRRDVAVHRIDGFEANELRPLGRQTGEQLGQMRGVVVAEDQPLGPAVADARNHRGMVHRVRQDDHAGHTAGERRQRRIVCDVARGKDQRRFAPVQLGKLAFE